MSKPTTVLPQSNIEILEEGDDALLPDAVIDEGTEEFVDLHEQDEKPQPVASAKKKKAAQPAADTATADDDLPADLKGKSPKEIAKMYRDAQQLIGRQGSELGDLRRRADLAIEASLRATAAAKPAAKADAAAEPQIDETDFFSKPKETIAKMIANHPLIQEIKQTLGQAAADQQTQRATAATERFNQAHPDAATILADPEFRQWVQASTVRAELLHRAHTRFDFAAGDEVFSTYKALKGLNKAAVADTAAEAAAGEAARTLAKRKQALRDAGVPSGAQAGAGKPSQTKKIYRRADVLKLMEEDPDRYDALAPEISQAYAEGRVR